MVERENPSALMKFIDFNGVHLNLREIAGRVIKNDHESAIETSGNQYDFRIVRIYNTLTTSCSPISTNILYNKLKNCHKKVVKTHSNK